MRAAKAHGGDPNECSGDDCFGPAFFIAAGLAAVATLLAALLTWRTRGVYQRSTAAPPAAAAAPLGCPAGSPDAACATSPAHGKQLQLPYSHRPRADAAMPPALEPLLGVQQ